MSLESSSVSRELVKLTAMFVNYKEIFTTVVENEIFRSLKTFSVAT